MVRSMSGTQVLVSLLAAGLLVLGTAAMLRGRSGLGAVLVVAAVLCGPGALWLHVAWAP